MHPCLTQMNTQGAPIVKGHLVNGCFVDRLHGIFLMMGPFAANSATPHEAASQMHHRIFSGSFGVKGHEPIAFRPAVDQTTDNIETIVLHDISKGCCSMKHLFIAVCNRFHVIGAVCCFLSGLVAAGGDVTCGFV